MKKLLSVLICVCMLLGALGAAPAEPVSRTHDGAVTMIDGAVTEEPIRSMEEAADILASLLDRLGGDERTQLDPWRTLSDVLLADTDLLTPQEVEIPAPKKSRPKPA